MSATSRSINYSRSLRLPPLTPTSISIRRADRSMARPESRCKTRRPSRFLRFTSPTSNSPFRTLDSIGHSTWSAARHATCIPSTHWISHWHPGEVVTLTCTVSHTTHGFRDGNEPPEFAYNGTFFDAGFFPTIGYDQGYELDDPRRRREEHLGKLQEMAQRGDPVYSRRNLFRSQLGLDYFPYHCQHLGGSNGHRSRIFAAHMEAGQSELLRIQHGFDAHCRFLCVPLGSLRYPQRGLPTARMAR